MSICYITAYFDLDYWTKNISITNIISRMKRLPSEMIIYMDDRYIEKVEDTNIIPPFSLSLGRIAFVK